MVVYSNEDEASSMVGAPSLSTPRSKAPTILGSPMGRRLVSRLDAWRQPRYCHDWILESIRNRADGGGHGEGGPSRLALGLETELQSNHCGAVCLVSWALRAKDPDSM